MADWSIRKNENDVLDGYWQATPMPHEDEGHTCIYAVDTDDRNFKVCIQCGHIEYRTDDEVLGEHVRKGMLHGRRSEP